MQDPQVDRMLREAIGASFVASLPADIVGRLIIDAVRLDIPAASTIYREGESPRFAVVAQGLLRVYLTSTEGRQVTVRYARAGSVLGAPVVIAGPVDTSVQALTNSTVFILNLAAIRALGQTDARVAWALAEEVSRRLYEVLEGFAGNVFGSVRQRVARHLLDLAAEHQSGTMLLAPVSQQELADAVGTVREVVARVLRELRDEGLIETSRQGVALLDATGLHGQANRPHA
jgi:CRP/FNR family cyclic AMP-dependent transcriptional regulator